MWSGPKLCIASCEYDPEEIVHARNVIAFFVWA